MYTLGGLGFLAGPPMAEFLGREELELLLAALECNINRVVYLSGYFPLHPFLSTTKVFAFSKVATGLFQNLKRVLHIVKRASSAVGFLGGGEILSSKN